MIVNDSNKQNQKISILFIHPCGGAFGGASRSLLEMINAFPEDSISPHVITQKGNFIKMLENNGIEAIGVMGVSQFDNTRYSHYLGVRWLILLREIFYLPFTLGSIVSARLKWKDIDLIHVNEITGILTVLMARIIFNKPIVVHVRSVQRREGRIRPAITKYVLQRCAAKVVAIDETVKKSLPGDIDAIVIHNGFILEEKKTSAQFADFFGKLPADSLKVAMVGNMLPAKGVLDFVEAAKICSEKKMKVDFIFVGDNPRKMGGMRAYILQKFHFIQDVKFELEKRIQAYGLQQMFHLIGFTTDIQAVYESIDVICFPSHLNAVGRPIIEASFSKVPGIVAIRDPLKDTIIEGETGICVEEKNPESLSAAIEYFYIHRYEVARMGDLAYKLARKNFDALKNAILMLDLYRSIIIDSSQAASNGQIE